MFPAVAVLPVENIPKLPSFRLLIEAFFGIIFSHDPGTNLSLSSRKSYCNELTPTPTGILLKCFVTHFSGSRHRVSSDPQVLQSRSLFSWDFWHLFWD